MKKLPASEHFGALAVVIPGLIGLLIVGRTLAAYHQRDAVASVVAATMALVLALGLVELLLRHYRAAELEREVRALPATASEAAVDAASPLLGLFLRARLEQAPSPTLGESIAPYLTGLLVMLGLLGTLFGLFETVSGASRALTASADVSALRAGLSTPIAGLTRSFGCSAAGIGASAMLGLALALVRRREGRTLRAIYGYATGPLRVLAPTRRQARALEQLAQQGTTMPEAAGALERVGQQLGALSTHMVALQNAGVEAQKRAFETLVAELRSELGRGAESAATALTTTLSPLLAETVSRAGEAAARQAGAMAEVARELSARLDADAALRRREAEQSAKQLAEVAREVSARLDGDAATRREQAAESAAQLAGVVRALGEELAQQAAARGRETEQTAALLTELGQSLSAQLEADGAARRREASELTREIVAQLRTQEEERAAAQRAELESLSELATRSVRAAEAREQGLDERWSALLKRADRSAESAVEHEAARLRELDALSTRIGEQLTRVADAVSTQVAELGQRAQREDARSAAALAALADNARAFEASIAAQRETMEQLVSGLAPLFAEVAEAAQRGASAALTELVTHTEERLGKIAETIDSDRAQRRESERTHDDHALEALARIDQTAGLLEGNIAQQRALLDGLVERVGGMVGELAEAARASSERTLARLADSAEEQAMRWAKLESELADGRLEHARGLEEQLTTHAERLERKVAEAGDVVRQAAAIWQASSAEMQTITELFATSVERQREASDAWLESLGDIEAAVERSGRHAAADALADQLASTQEVFARQLQFQRELFEQLRGLRASGRSSAVEHEAGGHDVSV